MKKTFTIILISLFVISVGYMIFLEHSKTSGGKGKVEPNARVFMGYKVTGEPICVEVEDTETEFDNRQVLMYNMNLPVMQRCN